MKLVIRYVVRCYATSWSVYLHLGGGRRGGGGGRGGGRGVVLCHLVVEDHSPHAKMMYLSGSRSATIVTMERSAMDSQHRKGTFQAKRLWQG